MKLHEIAGFDTPGELAQKIDWEGGLEEYLLNYEYPERFKDHPTHGEKFAQLGKLWREIAELFDDEGALP